MSDTKVLTSLVGFDEGPYYPTSLAKLQERCYHPETLPPWLFECIGGEDITGEAPYMTRDNYQWYRAVQFCTGNHAYVVLFPRMMTKHKRGVGPDRHVAIFAKSPMDEREQEAVGLAVTNMVIATYEEYRAGSLLFEGQRQSEEKVNSIWLLIFTILGYGILATGAYYAYRGLWLPFERFLARALLPFDYQSVLLILGLMVVSGIAFYFAARDPERR